MIRALLNIYILILIVDAILSYIPELRRQVWAMHIRKVANFTLKPIRKYLPPDMPIDISPVIVIVAIKLFEALF